MKYVVALICSFIVSSGSISAKELKLNEIKKIQAQLKLNEYLTVDMKQDVYRGLRNRHFIKPGKAYFMKPDMFRWVLFKPINDEWRFDGKTLINYKPGNKTANRYGVNAAQGRDFRSIVDMVMNLDTLFKRYDLVQSEKIGNDVFLQLKPKKSGEIVGADLTIDTKNNYIKVVKLKFRGKNNTVFSFTNPQTKKISKSNFSAPKGVKIMDVM